MEVNVAVKKKETEMKTKHTPGPWRIGDAGHTIFGPKQIDGSLPARIAEIANNNAFHANARLIAAAPELLEALERTVGALEAAQALACHEPLAANSLVMELQTSGGAVIAARAAIAKAKATDAT